MSVSDDLLGELAGFLWRGEAIPVYLAVACTDMQPLWNRCRDVHSMMRILMEADRIAACRCACACGRLVLPFVPEGESRPRQLLDACEAWLNRSVSTDVVVDALNSCTDWYQSFDEADHMLEEISGAVISTVLVTGMDLKKASFTSLPRCSVTPQHSANVLAMHKTGIRISIYDTEDPLPPSLSQAISEFLAEFCDVIRGIVPVAPKIADVVKACRESTVR